MKHTQLRSWFRRGGTALILTAVMVLGMIPAGAVDVELLEASQVDPESLFEPVTFSAAETVRSRNFNKDWKFILSSGNYAAAELDDSGWRKLNLPHDWSIEQDFTNSVSSEIGHLPGGTGWYRKHFTLPETLAGQRISVDFDGVYMDSHIYVNGQEVGNYPSGYMPFSYDITDYVTCDGQTDNVLAVMVTNITNQGQQSSRWYSGSGIYRDVYLTVTDPVHVAHFGTAITTPDLETEYGTGTVHVHAVTTVENDGETPAQVSVRSTVLDYAGTPIEEAVTSEAQAVEAGAKVPVTQTIAVSNPSLWSVDSPNLYLMKTEVLVDGQVADTYESRFGFKWSHFDNQVGFSLNGEPMKLKGVCMHHDQGALGAVDNPAAIRRQMQIMKDMGVNAIRVTHNPASPDLLQICDELGLMVIEEAFDTWYGGKNPNDYGRFFEKACTHPDAQPGDTWAKFDLQQMIRRGQNFPCIIMWSLGNEIGETNQEKGVQTARNLVNWAKEIDQLHPVTMGEDKFRMNAAWSTSASTNFIRVASLLDVVGMNYAESNYDGYRNSYPNWVIYGSETSSAVKSRGYYSDPQRSGSNAQDPASYQLSSYDNRAVPWGKTASNAWIPDRDRPWIQGEFIWTGFDYIGEPTPWNQSFSAPSKNSYFGIVDTAGFPKDDYFLYQSQWLDVNTDPMIHIFPHWNWENNDLRNKVTVHGQIPVRIYTNAPKAELFVDGVSQGVKEFTLNAGGFPQQSASSDRLYLEWPLTWEHVVGTKLEAKALDASGNVLATDVVVTAGDPARISLESDRNVITADGVDLAYITVDIQDAEGNFVPTAMNEVNFRIQGNGEIVGVDNGNSPSWEPYQMEGQWKRSAFNGKAVVIVRSTEETGSFTLTAQAPGLQESSVSVYTTASDVQSDTVLGYEAENILTDAGIVPELPSSVRAVLANGSKVDVPVTWEEITPEQVSAPARLTVRGTTDRGDTVTMVVIVRSPSGVRPITVSTAVGKLPTLPETVTVVWSDGKTESKAVTWGEITQEQVAQVGDFTVTGTVADCDFTATAYIHVKDAAYGNVALASNGTTVQVSYQEGVHSPSHLIDDDFSAENGWGNWESNNRRSDYAVLTFNQAYTIDKANVWINEKSDMTWQKPDRIQIAYWDGQQYVPVSNPSKTDNFVGQTNAYDSSYAGNEITFDPVTTSKVKVTFSLDRYNWGKNMMKIKELQIFGTMLPVSGDAQLAELLVNGQPVEGFSPETTSYFVAVDYEQDVPEVTAKADGLATVFVRQAISVEDAAVVEVTSEDGRTTNRYTVQFSRQAPQLKTVELLVAEPVVTNQKTALSAKGTMQDGTEVPAEKAVVTYAITEGQDKAEIKNGQLLPYEAGEIAVTASMTYQGKTVTSAPKTITIQQGAAAEISGFAPITVTTAPKAQPELPQTVTAHYTNGGLSRTLPVVWDDIDPQLYDKQNTFTVEGTVADTALRPTATVRVADVVAVESLSLAAAPGFTPELPQEAKVFFSDGTTGKLPITWNDRNEGTVTYGGREIPVPADVREAASTKSPNYAQLRTGYDLPVGIASYTNDPPESTDRAANLNDGNKSFTLEGKHIWCDWVRGGHRDTDWVSVIMAHEGIRVEREVNQISVGFMDEKGAPGSIHVPAAYYVEYYTGPLDYEMIYNQQQTNHVEDLGPEHPLNKAENWTEVTYVGGKPAVPGRNDDRMLDVTFEPVKTHLVRVRMDAEPRYCLGVNELEVFGQLPTLHNDYEIQNITVDGVNRLAEFQDKVLTITLKQGQAFPRITAEATNHASVTVIPATEQYETARIRFVPESGLETGIQEYEIRFQVEAQPEKLEIADGGRSLSLDDEIYINNYVTITGAQNIDLTRDAGMLIWYREIAEDAAVFGSQDELKQGLIHGEGNQYGQQTNGIAAKEYADVQYLRIYVKGTDGQYVYSPLKAYSVQRFCEDAVKPETNVKQGLKDTCVQLAHFGAAAQLYFGYNQDHLANANLAEQYPGRDWDPALLNAVEPFTTELTATEDIAGAGKSLSLDGKIAANFYYRPTGFQVADAQLLVWYDVTESLTEDNVKKTVPMLKAEDGRYGAQACSFAAKEYGKTIYVCAKMTDDQNQVHYSEILAYSPEAYASAVLSGTGRDTLKAAMQKMVLYGEEARLYFTK